MQHYRLEDAENNVIDLLFADISYDEIEDTYCESEDADDVSALSVAMRDELRMIASLAIGEMFKSSQEFIYTRID